MESEKKSIWTTVFGICLLAFFILFFVIMSMEDGSENIVIVTILYIIDIVLGIVSLNKMTRESAKSKNMTVAEYNESLKDEIEQRRKAMQEAKQPKTNSDGKVVCPKCGSTNIQIVKRGWKVTTGFIGSGKNERVCVNCMKRF